jgi:hypothetical protein
MRMTRPKGEPYAWKRIWATFFKEELAVIKQMLQEINEED